MQAPSYAGRSFGGMAGAGMGAYARPTYQGFGAMNGAPMQQVANGKQRAEEGVPKFDDAAFERAFELAQQDMVEQADLVGTGLKDDGATAQADFEARNVAMDDYQAQLTALEELNKMRLSRSARQALSLGNVGETDPVLLRIREKRPRKLQPNTSGRS